MSKMDDFVSQYGIVAESEYSDYNPHMSDSQRMNNYKTTLYLKEPNKRKRQFTLYFSKGLALEGEPTATEVLECLHSDINCVEYGFEDFLSNMGYEYPEGKRIYEVIERQAVKLEQFLGYGKFHQFKNLEPDW